PRRLLHALQPTLDRLEIGQRELQVDDLPVPDRIDGAEDVRDVRVVEAADDLDDRIHLADVREELVAETLALGCALDQPRDVHEGHDRRVLHLWTHALLEEVQPRVRYGDDADIRVDGAERVILGGRARAGQCVEERGLPDIREPYDS